MDSFEKLERALKSPDRRYAVYQIIHDGAAIPEKAEYYDGRWFGGVVGNLQYTRDFPDDEAAWKAIEAGMREYIRRGMHTWIYDESGYPSGTGGGYVTEYNPQFVAKGLYCYDYWRVITGPGAYRADVPGDKLWKAVLISVDGGDPIDVTCGLNERGTLYINVPCGRYYLFMMSIRRLFDGTHATESYSEPRNYISLADRAAAKSFIECTHERYKARLSDEFGRGILATFTDEPSLISWNIRTGVFPILPWLDSYPDDFEKKYGYPFVNACVAVVLNRGECTVKRRCDFWEFIADGVAEGYFAEIEDWCHKNNLKSSGHMLEEERLQAHVYNYGSFFRSMRHFDWPGIDQLNTEPSVLMNDTHVPIARFVASFADINGEHEVFTEFSDHSVRERGARAGIECYYGSVNWHLAMGVNNFTSYYSWDGITKEETADFNRYTARSGYILRQGIRDSRVAVFYPEAAMWAAYTPSTAARAVDSSEKMLSVERAFAKVSWDLLHRQIDFDYIDSRILAAGEIKNGKLCYGDRTYSAVVLPCARVLEAAAMEKLLDIESSGIAVFFCGEIPEICRESGDRTQLCERIANEVKNGSMFASETADFGRLIDEKLPDKCRPVSVSSDKGTYWPMLLSHSRVTGDGMRIVYIANMANEDFGGTVRAEGDYSSVYEADDFSGEMFAADCKRGENDVSVDVSLKAGEARFFIMK